MGPCVPIMTMGPQRGKGGLGKEGFGKTGPQFYKKTKSDLTFYQV